MCTLSSTIHTYTIHRHLLSQLQGARSREAIAKLFIQAMTATSTTAAGTGNSATGSSHYNSSITYKQFASALSQLAFPASEAQVQVLEVVFNFILEVTVFAFHTLR
jgi:hypothetical protein